MMKSLLIIGTIWPEPNSTAAGSRMMQLIELFQENDFKITYASAASINENSFPLAEIKIKTIQIQLNNSDFDAILKHLNPTITLFDRFITEEQYGWRVSEICPDSIRVLDTEDLHFLRHARTEAYKKNHQVSLNYLINDTTKREIASIYRCDLTLIISKYEFNLLRNTFKINESLLMYIPFLLNQIKATTIYSYPTYTERKDFMTIGNFLHEPNWNSVLHLKNIIWPLIKSKLPNAEMHIYGSYASEKVKQLHNKKDHFHIKGWAESAEETFKNYKVCLAPLQFGAGLKGKLIDAMQFGTPSVTTTIGGEAMHDELPWNGYISDQPKEFVEKAIELYSNEDQWCIAQKNGISIINECYSKDKFTALLLQRIFNIQNDIETHRINNFTGAMLMHHTIKSTKYLSKWIEEKNR